MASKAMIKKIGISFASLLLFALYSPGAQALSNYVLPYPSAMPGSIFYKLDSVQEKLTRYWYFGNFGQFHYNLKYSDKYLVEAKTLLEYKQYLLGHNALIKSNNYFAKTYPYLTYAKEEGKDASENLYKLSRAALKHKEILEVLRKTTPSTFNWSPENLKPTMLDFNKLINSSLDLRNEYL